MFAAFDELGDAPATLAAELRVALTAKLALASLSAATAELRVALTAELTFAGLATLPTEIRVPTGAELLLPRLTAAPADLPIELGAVLGRRLLATLASGLADARVTALVHR